MRRDIEPQTSLSGRLLLPTVSDNRVLDPHVGYAYGLRARRMESSARFAEIKAKEVPAFVFE
ncbi:hypothetical protein PCAR4_300022 [Paraburkholderia caribensis]|nr:hypothetical protein PCAR4_300022 [Paraburkholderia caribensis]